MPNELSWFIAEGFVYDVEQQNPAGTSTQPQLLDVSAYVNFFPGNQAGPFETDFAAYVPNLDHGDGTSGNTLVPMAPISGRLMNGALCTVAVGDPVGVELLAGATLLGLPTPLFYHVQFENVTYGGGVQALPNFAFQAPTGADSPSSLAAVAATTGGTVAAGTHYYGVTAKYLGGETAPSNIVAVTTSGATSSVTLTFQIPAGVEPQGFNIYRGNSATTLNTLVGVISNGQTASFIDTGSLSTTQAPPTASNGSYVDLIDIASPLLTRYQYGGPN